jgi:hypothetical protein
MDRRLKILLIKSSTVLVALCLVIVIGVLVTEPNAKTSEKITITKEYQPSEEIAMSLESNKSVNRNLSSNGSEDSKDMPMVSTKEESLSTLSTNSDASIHSDMEITSNDTSNDTSNETSKSDVSNNISIQKTDKKDPVESADSSSNTNNVTESEEDIIIEDAIEIPNGLTEEEEIQYVKDKWVDALIHENKNDINQNDLSQGASIYNSLDTSYLFGLAKDGLTPEEKQEAMNYLEANLAPEQLELAKVLFNKYVGLVN